MAGIIAASDNGFGLIGAAPGVSLYALKIFPKSGDALTSNVIRAVEWASRLEEEAYARARRNVLVIAAVGNHAARSISRPPPRRTSPSCNARERRFRRRRPMPSPRRPRLSS